MRTSRLWRLAMACRPSYVLTLVLVAAIPLFGRTPRPLAGVVVDQPVEPLPRAYVRVARSQRRARRPVRSPTTPGDS